MNLLLERVRLALAEFDLAVDLLLRSRVTGISGRSGAGKTTLLEIVAGLREPAEGRLSLDGRDLLDRARGFSVPPRLRRIGYVPQDETLFPHLSVRRNVFYGSGGRSSEGGIDPAHVVGVLELAPLLDRDVRGLSGGERRRIALARALLSSPLLLLFDEPLTGLDRGHKGRILSYLQTIRAEFDVPMLYVAHDRDEVLALCDEVIVLERGRVEGCGKPKDVFGAGAEGEGLEANL